MKTAIAPAESSWTEFIISWTLSECDMTHLPSAVSREPSTDAAGGNDIVP